MQTILITETATDTKHYVEHNKFYDQVLVPKVEGYMGQSLQGLNSFSRDDYS